MNEGNIDVTVSKPAAEQLRDILEGRDNRPFDESGCSDQVRRRILRLTVVAALVLLVVLIALVVF